MNIPLLQRLRAADGGFLSLSELGSDLDTVQRDLAELRDFGYAIEHHPYRGAAFRGPADRLCPDAIEWELGTRRIGRRIAVWNRVSSTNDLAVAAAASRANDGLIVLAEDQTAGRGRRGRSWSAPPATSILLSALVFPPPPLAEPSWLTALGAVAAAEVVELCCGRPARIKWPNDVRVEGRKIAGVLVERGEGSVIGIGLNVNTTAALFPAELRGVATSLSILCGDRLDRSELARLLIQRLDAHYANGIEQGVDALNKAWRGRLEPLGRHVRLATPSGPILGRLTAADLTAGLTIENPHGESRLVPHAEILSFESDTGSTHI